MIWFVLALLIFALIVGSNRRRAIKYQIQNLRERQSITDRPADILVSILMRHIPALVAKATPYIRRDAYGVLTVGPEFDGEIRYFVDRVILADPAYVRSSVAAIRIDPDARARLFDSPQVIERQVRNMIVAAYQDKSAVDSLSRGTALDRLINSGYKSRPLPEDKPRPNQSAADERRLRQLNRDGYGRPPGAI
jgi:hypothetical protein